MGDRWAASRPLGGSPEAGKCEHGNLVMHCWCGPNGKAAKEARAVTPSLAQLVLAYEQALSTPLWSMNQKERAQDALKVAEAYRAMVAQAKAEQ